MIDVSFIIVSFNSKKYITPCIRSLLSIKTHLKKEIIVIDNASKDETITLLKKLPIDKIVSNKKNIGFTRASNKGIKIAKGRYYFLINPDSQYKKGSLDNLIKYLDKNKDVYACGIKLLFANGKIQYSCRGFPSYYTYFFNSYSLLVKYFQKSSLANRYLRTKSPHTKIEYVDWISGAGMIIRKTAVNNIGYLDKRFFMYCEDLDYCRRIYNINKKVLYFPDLVFVHHCSGSSSAHPLRCIFWHHQSMWQYYKKYFKANLILKIIVFSGISLRYLGYSLRTVLKTISNRTKKFLPGNRL